MRLVPWNIERLPEMVTLWNKELGSAFPMRQELFAQNSFKDENVCYDGSRIALDMEDNIIGFIVAKRWQENLNVEIGSKTGWIQVLLVDRKYRYQGIGTALLKHVEATFRAHHMERILLGRDPWHYFPGVPVQYEDTAAWFELRGYTASGIDHDLVCTYENTENDNIPSGDNVTYSILEEVDKDRFLDFLHRSFPGRWEYEAIHYFKKGGTGREFVVLKKWDQIIGFCRINDAYSPQIAQNVYWSPLFKGKLGGIGPLGIDANERKQGYGLAIVEAGVAFLRKRGITNIVIDWTGLVAFYEKLGYSVWKSYDAYKKELFYESEGT
jgi:GNAT superfamily N-acetyltransferase